MSARRAFPACCAVVLWALAACGEADGLDGGEGGNADGAQVADGRPAAVPLDPLAEIEAFVPGPGQTLDVVEVRDERGELTLRRGVLRDADGMVNHGRFQRWHPNGQLAEDGHYLAGQRHGRYTVIAETGMKETEIEYRRGVKHGEALSWGPMGAFKERAHFRDGVLHGEFDSRSGSTRVRGTYAGAVEVGLWTWTDADGNRLREGSFEQGARSGLWRTWHAGEVLATEETYVAGQIEGVLVEYDAQGVRRAEREYVAGVLQGEVREYHPDGSPSAAIAYADGLPHGPQTRWYEGGALQMQGSMERGKRNGQWVYYRPDGSRNEAWSGTYEADVRVGD
jgi:antitoxin component YwqK of YwqJK toxin-antitoxin module